MRSYGGPQRRDSGRWPRDLCQHMVDARESRVIVQPLSSQRYHKQHIETTSQHVSSRTTITRPQPVFILTNMHTTTTTLIYVNSASVVIVHETSLHPEEGCLRYFETIITKWKHNDKQVDTFLQKFTSYKRDSKLF